MEFYYDLIPKYKIKNKFWRYTFAVLLYIFVIAYVVAGLAENNLRPSFYFTAVFWTLYALIMSYQFITGKTIDALFGKKYIRIN